MEPVSSWMVVRFISAEPRLELPENLLNGILFPCFLVTSRSSPDSFVVYKPIRKDLASAYISGLILFVLPSFPTPPANHTRITWRTTTRAELLFFFFFFGHACGIWKFQGQGSNPSHNSDLSLQGHQGTPFPWLVDKLLCMSHLSICLLGLNLSVEKTSQDAALERTNGEWYFTNP